VCTPETSQRIIQIHFGNTGYLPQWQPALPLFSSTQVCFFHNFFQRLIFWMLHCVIKFIDPALNWFPVLVPAYNALKVGAYAQGIMALAFCFAPVVPCLVLLALGGAAMVYTLFGENAFKAAEDAAIQAHTKVKLK
jgi:hypothetical protein